MQMYSHRPLGPPSPSLSLLRLLVELDPIAVWRSVSVGDKLRHYGRLRSAVSMSINVRPGVTVGDDRMSTRAMPSKNSQVSFHDPETGRSLQCTLLETAEIGDDVYACMLPVDVPVSIYDQADMTPLANDRLLQDIVGSAQAACSEIGITLMRTPETLTVAGEILDEDGYEADTEEHDEIDQDDDEEEEEEEEEDSPPAKSPAKSPAAAPAKSPAKSPAAAPAKPTESDDDDDEDEESEEEDAAAAQAAAKAAKAGASKAEDDDDDEDDEESEEEDEPAKGGAAKAAAAAGGDSDDDDEDDEEEDDDDDDDDDDDVSCRWAWFQGCIKDWFCNRADKTKEIGSINAVGCSISGSICFRRVHSILMPLPVCCITTTSES